MIQVTTLPQMQKTNVAVWLKVLLAVHVQSEVNFKLDIQTVARFWVATSGPLQVTICSTFGSKGLC